MTITLTDVYSWAIAHCTTPAEVATAMALPGSWAMGAQQTVWVRDDQIKNLPTPPVAGFAVWHDATTIAAQTDNTPLASWPAAVGTATLIPVGGTITYRASMVNGRPAVFFSAGSGAVGMQCNATTRPQPVTMMVVYSATDLNPAHNLILFDNYDNANACAFGFLGLAGYMSGGAPSIGSSETLTAGPHLSGLVFNGISSTATLDGVTVSGDVGIGGMHYATIGNNRVLSAGWGGYICEIAMYGRALNAYELAQWRTYAQTKWGTP